MTGDLLQRRRLVASATLALSNSERHGRDVDMELGVNLRRPNALHNLEDGADLSLHKRRTKNVPRRTRR